MMLVLVFFSLLPRVYMITPQLTEQYGHVPRVSVVCASLKARTSASASCGEKPSPTAEDVPSPVAQIRKNWRRLSGAFIESPGGVVAAALYLFGACAKNLDNLNASAHPCAQKSIVPRALYARSATRS